MQNRFLEPLQDSKSFEDLAAALKKENGPVQATGCSESQKIHLAAAVRAVLKEQGKWMVYVTDSESRAREITEDLRLFEDSVYFFPAKDAIFYSADIQGKSLVESRMRVIRAIGENKGGVLVTTISGLMNRIPPRTALTDRSMVLEVGQEFDGKELRKKLTELGYESVIQVEEPGQFAVRGGIVDIYSMTEESPFRLEFWGDEIDAIRSFETESQRSIENLEVVEIFPAGELIYDTEQREKACKKIRKEYEKVWKSLRAEMKTEQAYRLKSGVGELLEQLENGMRDVSQESLLTYFYPEADSLISYLNPKTCLYILDEPVRLKESADAVEAEFRESMSYRLQDGYVLAGQTNVLLGADEAFAAIPHEKTISLTSLDQKIPFLSITERGDFSSRISDSYRSDFESLIRDLKKFKKEKWRIILLSPSRTRAQRLAENLREYELSAYYTDTDSETGALEPGTIAVIRGNLHRGFLYPQLRFAVLTENDLFGAEKRRKKKKKNAHQGTKISGYGDLSVGDYVVHEVHGIGIYRGTVEMELDHQKRDYMKIEYRDGGALYVPATNFDVIQKYADANAEHAKVNRLGGTEWKKTRTKVQRAVDDMAKELVELYSARQNGTGFACGPDTVWQKEFEELFPYEETDDQLNAIEATKKDMESTRIMDRLICGDVGFGKTEIAIRAAFKAVQEGKQVVYLVPTTILAQQHFNTFAQRMKDYPVSVGLLSRFCSTKQINETIKGLTTGQVDIVIGTHRVLSKDVQFKDLGLLIIDEEQRFGVRHKERIKQLKNSVDVISMSATPIPRTLHMSLIGIRDMSILEEAPSDRLPIQTYVMEWNPQTVREAINRELARGGQVYYVYNRVQDIDEMTAQIQELVPDANVQFAHGQMSEHQMERVMMDFVQGEIDVLVSTTIIETGLDISNVNTILIHDADRFGLSTLYQLRGRVGRSNRQSYAFILYRRNKVLKEVAEKRLEAIRQFTELGSGIHIAMRDLEIRGAGSVLGSSQHGHMEAVGYDLYCKMLSEAVAELKGEKPAVEEAFDTTVDMPISAFLPSTYVRNEKQKMDLYRRIAGVTSEEERVDMEDELTDRYGEPPVPVLNLIQIAVLRSMAHEIYATDLQVRGSDVTVKLYQGARIAVDRIPELLQRYPGRMRVVPGNTPIFRVDLHERGKKAGEVSLADLKRLLIDMREVLSLEN